MTDLGSLAGTAQEFKTVEAPLLPKTAQEVSDMAFKTAIDPARESFKKNLGTTVETLSQRGVFGNLGQERLGDILKEQQRLELGVAGQIGTQLGQTAMEQAFTSSEAAKSRQQQKELLGTELDFKEEQAEIERGFKTSERLGGQEFLTGLEGLRQENQESLSNLNATLQQETATFVQKLKGGTDEKGNALTDVQVDQKVTDMQTAAAKELTKFQNLQNKGLNPDTGLTYTDTELNDISYQRQLDLADKEFNLNKELQDDLLKIQNGTNKDGSIMSGLQREEAFSKMRQKVQDDVDEKAFNEALIEEFGPEGIEIANNLAELRGKQAKLDIAAINKILASEMKETDKNKAVSLILSGVGYDSDEVLATLPLTVKDALGIEVTEYERQQEAVLVDTSKLSVPAKIKSSITQPFFLG